LHKHGSKRLSFIYYKIWASALLIILLVIDQNITKNVATYEKIRTGIVIAIIGVAVIGFILYGLRARL
jgi:ABC-type Fe3+-siderophore transport system permease subunit